MGNSEVLTWAAGWHGDDLVYHADCYNLTRRQMLKQIYDLIDEADVVVTYNGDKFDLKILNQEFMLQGWTPPAPYKSIDMLKIMKRSFRGTSNKLDYWLKRLGLGGKIEHRGYSLWLDCMAKKPEAFEEMIEYNIGDVVQLEKLFDRVRPWIHNLPSLIVFDDEGGKCPHCGSVKYQNRGWYMTKTLRYKRHKCSNQNCGRWFRSRKSTPLETEREVFVGVN